MLESKGELVPNLVRGHRRDGRCLYDKKAKRELVRRCLEPGVSLAGTALAHGINANLPRKWVDSMSGRARARRVRALMAPRTSLLPVRLEEPRASRTSAPTDGYVELVVPGGTVRVYGRIDGASLRVVVDCPASRA